MGVWRGDARRVLVMSVGGVATQTIVVRAGGTGSAGSAPAFTVFADGVAVGQATILNPLTNAQWAASARSGFQDYVFSYDAPASAARVEIVYANDGRTSDGVDRNLYVDHIVAGGRTYQSETDGFYSHAGGVTSRNFAREDMLWNGRLAFDDLTVAGGGGAPTPPVAGPIRIMPLGASFTEGTPEFPGGYRPALWDKFVTGGWEVDFLGSRSRGPDTLPDRDHEGRGGDRVIDILNKIERLTDDYQPDIVLLLVGTNDAIRRADPASYYSEQMLQVLRAFEQDNGDVEIFLANLPEVDPALWPRVNEEIDVINALYPGIVATARSEGIDVTPVDMRGLTVEDFFDGLHPDADGNVEMAGYWYDALLRESAYFSG